MSYFKKEERTASTKQIEKLAEVFIGILNSQKKLNIDMTDKPTKADAVLMTVDCIREWETECRADLHFQPLTMADISTFYDMSYRRKGVWCYEEDAAVIALVEEKMLEKFSSFCPMASLGEKQAEAETFTVNTYDPKTGESGSKTIKKKQPTKKKKTAKKQPITLKVSEPVEKPIDELKAWNPTVAIKITDEVLELASSMGLSDTETAKLAHTLAKVNS